MWWLPLATAAVLVVIIGALQLWHRQQRLDQTTVYRRQYLQLVGKLDVITSILNELEPLVPQVHDPKILDYFESSLRLQETLLVAMNGIAPFGSDSSVLMSANYLSEDCRQRAVRLKVAFSRAVKGKALNYHKLTGTPSSALRAAGCFFCSRPADSTELFKVRVRLDGAVKQVESCAQCRDELKRTKKVKVLYFLKEGRPVHWSEIVEYKPTVDYWNLNQPAKPVRAPKLALVYSQPSDETQ